MQKQPRRPLTLAGVGPPSEALQPSAQKDLSLGSGVRTAKPTQRATRPTKAMDARPTARNRGMPGVSIMEPDAYERPVILSAEIAGLARRAKTSISPESRMRAVECLDGNLDGLSEVARETRFEDVGTRAIRMISSLADKDSQGVRTALLYIMGTARMRKIKELAGQIMGELTSKSSQPPSHD